LVGFVDPLAMVGWTASGGEVSVWSYQRYQQAKEWPELKSRGERARLRPYG